jgi:hypothetical protein
MSSADAAAIAAADLAHALQQPAPTTPFKQPGTDRMQAIRKLAAIFEEMAPARDNDKRTAPTPRVTPRQSPEQPDPSVQTPTPHKEPAPAPRVQEDVTWNLITEMNYLPRRSPRTHAPPQVTQEERAYQILDTPLPHINKAYAVTDMTTGQQLEYRQLLKRPELRPIWEKRSRTNWDAWHKG